MNKIYLILIASVLVLKSNIVIAQSEGKSWSFGFGLDYPRFFSSDVKPQTKNSGVFLSLQHNFIEFIGLRFTGEYDRLEGHVLSNSNYYLNNGTIAPSSFLINTRFFSGNLDLLYYFTYCSQVSAYFGFGAGLTSYITDWGNVSNPNAVTKTAAQMNAYLGSEWKLSGSLNLKTEFEFHSTDGEFDGIIDNNRKGIFGSNSDAYISVSAGIQYYFWKDVHSKYCEIKSGIISPIQAVNNYPTLEKIDDVIKKHTPIIKENKIEITDSTSSVGTELILFGINFAPNKFYISVESYPVLVNTVRVLKDNPGVKIKIDGYCDNSETQLDSYFLSQKRADAVKEYLVSQGIDKSRIITAGLGYKNPVADNNSKSGRARNRRIEFKIVK